MSQRLHHGRLIASVSDVVDAGIDLLPDFQLAAIPLLDGAERPAEWPTVRRRLQAEGVRSAQHRGVLLLEPGELDRFSAVGLFAGNAQAGQGMGMIVFPFAFVSSAYVPVSSMPGWRQVFAAHQPLTYMVDAVRALTGGQAAVSVLGHGAGYFVVRSLLWAAAIVALFAPVAVARYRRG